MKINKFNGNRIVEINRPVYLIRSSLDDPYCYKEKFIKSVLEVGLNYSKCNFKIIEYIKRK